MVKNIKKKRKIPSTIVWIEIIKKNKRSKKRVREISKFLLKMGLVRMKEYE